MTPIDHIPNLCPVYGGDVYWNYYCKFCEEYDLTGTVILDRRIKDSLPEEGSECRNTN